MQEVGGSIPPGSTSLRELRLGKPAPIYRSEASEGCRGVARRAKLGLGKCIRPLQAERRRRSAMKYVYILESLDSLHFYIGITDDLRAGLQSTMPARCRTHRSTAVAHQDLHRFQRREAGRRIRKVPEVSVRPSICQEAPLTAPTPQSPHSADPSTQRSRPSS